MKKATQKKKLKIFICLLVLSFVVSNYAIASDTNSTQQKTKSRKTTTQAQEGPFTLKGAWEFSTATSIDIQTISAEGVDSESITTLAIPVRLGYYLTSNIEIEPEIDYWRTSQEDTSYSQLFLLGNIAFNFPTSSQMVPFVIGGAGIVNVSASYDSESDTESKVVFNGGGGIKWFASDIVAIRAEYRLLYYSDKPEGSESSIRFLTHKIYIGISIFF